MEKKEFTRMPPWPAPTYILDIYMSEVQKSSSKSGSHSMGVSKRVLRARSARSERSEPRERSEACSERSDEVRDCKLHITQTKART